MQHESVFARWRHRTSIRRTAPLYRVCGASRGVCWSGDSCDIREQYYHRIHGNLLCTRTHWEWRRCACLCFGWQPAIGACCFVFYDAQRLFTKSVCCLKLLIDSAFVVFMKMSRWSANFKHLLFVVSNWRLLCTTIRAITLRNYLKVLCVS